MNVLAPLNVAVLSRVEARFVCKVTTAMPLASPTAFTPVCPDTSGTRPLGQPSVSSARSFVVTLTVWEGTGFPNPSCRTNVTVAIALLSAVTRVGFAVSVLWLGFGAPGTNVTDAC